MTENAPGQRPASAIYSGRAFTPAELSVIRRLAESLPTRRAIADAVCDALGRRRADGRRKDMSARVALVRIARQSPRWRIGLTPGRSGRHVPIQWIIISNHGQTSAALGPKIWRWPLASSRPR
jgi:hypothetical protein